MKKVLVLALVTAMLLTVFAACSKPTEPTPPPPPAPGVTAVPGQIGTKEAPVGISILIKDVPPSEEGVKQLKAKIEEGMAADNKFITLTFLEAPTGTYAEVVPLAIRTGQITPDLVYFQGGDLSIAQEGLLEDLTPYIEKSTYVKPLLQEHNKQCLANYPYLLWLSPARVQLGVIRSDWVEKLPTAKAVIADPTVDNYHAMFKELVDTKLAKYAISTDKNTTRMDNVFNHAFGVTGAYVKEDGKYISYMASKVELAKLEFYATLYKEKLLDPEYLTTEWDALEQKFYDGSVGMIAGTQGAVIKIYEDKMTTANGAGSTLTVLPPAKGVSQGVKALDTSRESRGIAMLSENKNNEAAFAVLDFMASSEGRKLDLLGIEGTHYNVTDNKIVTTDRFAEWWPRFWESRQEFNPGKEFASVIFPKPAEESLEMAKTYFKGDKTNLILPAELIPLNDAMSNLYKEFAADVITGKRSAKDFDAYLTKFNANGGTKVNEYINTNLK